MALFEKRQTRSSSDSTALVTNRHPLSRSAGAAGVAQQVFDLDRDVVGDLGPPRCNASTMRSAWSAR